MNILIFGAGAIGSFVGGILSQEYNVTLIGRKPHLDAINEHGLKVSGNTNMTYYPATAENVEKYIENNPDKINPDLVIITVKSYNTHVAIQALQPLINENVKILSLQNGLTNLETIKNYYRRSRVLGGVISHGVIFKEPGRIEHAGSGEIILGGFGQVPLEEVKEVTEAFNKAGLSAIVTDNILGELWVKAAVNASINPLTAIIGQRNGYLLEVTEFTKLVETICNEVVTVGRSAGVRLPQCDMINKTKTVIKMTSENRSSMLQDIERGRQTEIDAINGAIVNVGKKYGVNAPINDALTILIKGIEHMRSQELK
jgi:2-dehydropantoate 2-reductase